jgi:hypothetical protein
MVSTWPSTSGLRFANAWPHVPDLALRIAGRVILPIGDAANGLCGGMTFVAADRHLAAAPAWSDAAPPDDRSVHFRTIVRRQIDSLAFGRLPLRFYSLMAFRPERPTVWGGLLRRSPRPTATIRDEWPRIRAELDAGRPAAIGLVRVASPNPFQLTRNHQVLAYGYALDDNALTISIYDPNHPLDDTVELRVELGEGGRGATLSQSTGESLVAFFRAPYAPRPPVD